MSYRMTPSDTIPLELSTIHITGNVIPPNWLSHLRTKGDQPHFTAAWILSDLVYWYSPTEVRDDSGYFVRFEKKYIADKLQKSYYAWAKTLGVSKQKIREAVYYLRDKGLLDIECRNIYSKTDGPVIWNATFFAINTGEILRISMYPENHDEQSEQIDDDIEVVDDDCREEIGIINL